VEEIEDRAGADFVKRFDRILALARALLQSDREMISFHFADGEDRLFKVIMLRDPIAQSRQFTSVEMQLTASPFDMTLRELDILTLVAAGFTNDTIAARLGISMRTVAKHIENIFNKAQFFSRTALASLAIDKGLCVLPIPGGADGVTLAVGELERLSLEIARSQTSSQRSAPRPTAKMRPLTIGVPYAAEGRGASDSVEMLNGSILAVDELNRRGGIHGRTVILRTIAFRSEDAQSIRDAYAALINEDVDAISAGYACYSPSIHDLVGDSGIPYLHAATMRSAVERVRESRSRLGNIFQTCASDANYGLGLTRFVRQAEQERSWFTQLKRIVVVQPKWLGLDIGIERMEGELSRSGWTTDIVEVAGHDPHRWNEAVERLHGLKPSIVVFSSFFVEDAINFHRAFSSAPLRSIIYSIYAPSVPQYREELGDQCEGVVWATTSGLYSDTIAGRFRQQYVARYRQAPGSSQAGLAYDRVNLLSGAWTGAGHPRIFGDVLNELRGGISRGVNGSYSLGNSGQVGLAYPDDTEDLSISQAHLIFQIQGGRDVTIGPAPFVQRQLQIPWWVAKAD
jgi:branched-chain amino acid transport system substrate-binding protein